MNIPRYWSLLEMIEHFAPKFCSAYYSLRAQIDVLHLLDKEHRNRPLDEKVLSDGRKKFIADLAIIPIMEEAKHLNFPADIRAKGARLYARLVDKDSRIWTAEMLLDSLTDFHGDIAKELKQHKFFHIASGNESYLENDKLFGPDVYEKFKSARQDIKDAGNCFSTELYTACVFHLMRVSEHGFRIIAKRFKVSIYNHGKRIPLAFGTWNDVLNAIRIKIDKSRQGQPANAKREARLDYYSDALDRCSAMKELYRNPVSHTRGAYTKGKALDAMERVRNFMQFLARPIPR